MAFKCSVFVSRSKVALSVLAFSCALVAAAEAPPRGAPIVYKNGPGNGAALTRMAQEMPVISSGPADKATARITFRYPASQPVVGEFRTASAQPSAIASTVRESAYSEVPQVVAPARPAVEAVSLEAMPEPAGQGMVYTATPAPVAAPAARADLNAGFVETGMAIVYGEEFAGLPTANGEIFNQMELTAAHPSLPLPSLVQVTHVESGREVVVRVNDRGPFEDNANLQLSRKAAEALGIQDTGQGAVSIRYLSRAPALAAKPAPLKSPPYALPPASAPGNQASVSQMAATSVPAEDELLGGGATTVSSPRLMTLTAPPVAAATGGVFVQLASFSDIGNAEAMLRRLDASLPVEIMSARVNGADFFRVRVGPFLDHTEAEQVRATLYSNGTAEGRIVSGS